MGCPAWSRLWPLLLLLCARGEVEVRFGAGTTDADASAALASVAAPANAPPARAGGPGVLAALARACVSTADGRYTVCLFENVTQRDDNGNSHFLGSWRRWSPRGEMQYSDGAECAGQLRRNATVALHCGADALSLGQPAEPSMCRYTLVLQVPVSCALLESADYGAASESDVLRDKYGRLCTDAESSCAAALDDAAPQRMLEQAQIQLQAAQLHLAECRRQLDDGRRAADAEPAPAAEAGAVLAPPPDRRKN
ncbi:hypothetical protein M885DRAFT_551998 [Pelagophyceae sp. CCMP2097]|nr:hypothetical protein M885DRAFT_551998 [Pelagophyceae sp. CCMP2097]